MQDWTSCLVGSFSKMMSFVYLAEPCFEASAAADNVVADSVAADSVVAFNVVANSVIVDSVGADRATKLQQAALRCKACRVAYHVSYHVSYYVAYHVSCHVAYLLCLCSGISAVCHQQLDNLQMSSNCSQMQCRETLHALQLTCHAMHHVGKHQCRCHGRVYLLSQIRCLALPKVTCIQYCNFGNMPALVHKGRSCFNVSDESRACTHTLHSNTYGHYHLCVYMHCTQRSITTRVFASDLAP